MAPIRDLGAAVATVAADRVRAIAPGDFQAALRAIRPSVGRAALERFEQWTSEYGAPA